MKLLIIICIAFCLSQGCGKQPTEIELKEAGESLEAALNDEEVNVELPDLTEGMSEEEKEEFNGLLAKANAGDAESQFQVAAIWEKKWVEYIPGDPLKDPKIGSLYDQMFTAAESKDKKRVEELTNEINRLLPEFYKKSKRSASLAMSEHNKWLTKAAEHGHILAMGKLAYSYGNAPDAVNLAKSVKWWRKAADLGDANAQLQLGILYSEGKGVEKDEKESVKWWTKAAEQGNGDAALLLRLHQKEKQEEAEKKN